LSGLLIDTEHEYKPHCKDNDEEDDQGNSRYSSTAGTLLGPRNLQMVPIAGVDGAKLTRIRSYPESWLLGTTITYIREDG